MSKRFELINFLNAHDNFRDNKNNKKLDSFDVVGLLNHYDELQTLLVDKDQRIAELEEQLKNAIRFKTPQVERFAVVQYIHWEKKPYKIVNCFDAYKDENMKTRYCFYGVSSTNFKVIQICDTKEEALKKLEELKGENK